MRSSRAAQVSGPTDHVVIVGAGLGGLACALHLAGAGRRVTVLERESGPGGRSSQHVGDGFTFDTGPTVLTMPELIERALAAVGEPLGDWLSLTRLDPAYRAWFADGSRLDVIAQPERMADEVARVCGPREADGYRRFVAYVGRLWRLERAAFVERNFDGLADALSVDLLRLAALGAFGGLQRRVDRFFTDERLRRVFSFQSMYAGLAPDQARAAYLVIAYLDSIQGVYYPRGGMYQVPLALAGAAAKHGVSFEYGATASRVEVRSGRAVAVHTVDGRRFAADAVVLNLEPPAARALLPAALTVAGRGGPRSRRVRYSPSCVVIHLGVQAGYEQCAHHNIHFGESWRATFAEVIGRGQLMSDPSILVTIPSRSDPSVAPPGRSAMYVLAPVPNLDLARFDWPRLADDYADEIVEHLQRRGYPGLAEATVLRRVVTPADWAGQGLPAGTPFSAAHTLRQSGPLRTSNRIPGLANVVLTGSGTIPGVGVPMVLISGWLAAQRIAGSQV